MKIAAPSDDTVADERPVTTARWLARTLACGEGARPWPAPLLPLSELMFAAAQPMCIVWGPRLELIYNDAYALILGDGHPTAFGRPAHEVWAEAWPVVGPLVDHCYGGVAVRRDQLALTLTRHGLRAPAWFSLSLTPIRGDEGAILGAFCVCTETTEAVEAEQQRVAHATGAALAQQQLRESHARYKELLDSISDGFVLMDEQFRIVEINAQGLRIDGRPLDSIIGRTHWDLWPTSIGSAVESALLRVLHERAMVELKHRYATPGSEVWLHIRAYPVSGGVACLYSDITATVHAQEAAAQAAQALRDADRRKDEFLATLAHELRNPLAPIRTAAQLLGRPGLPAQRVTWCSELIQRQSQTMALLLDDLLEVGRITSGRLELKKAEVSIRSIVDAAVETSRPSIDAKRHRLEVDLSQPLSLVEADPLRVAQVLTNLLTNAAKYTDPGGCLRVSAAVEGDEVCFTVADNGVGIAPDVLPAIFEMFRQVKGTLDRAEGGLGIGLALSKGLVELHGGRIEAHSEGAGRGAVFRVWLPLGLSRDSEPAALEDDVARSSTAGMARRVLVADDNVDAARTLGMVLELEGYEVHMAHDGVLALDLAVRVRPDAVFLDIGMPGMDGYRVANRLRQEPWGREVLIVATTGWGQEEDRQRAMAAGFDHHLTKPIDPMEMVRLLQGRRPHAPHSS